MNAPTTSGRWTRCTEARQGASLRLFCFPYAGGGATAYRAWSAEISRAIEVLAVQLPGREARYREPALTSIEALIPRLVDGLVPELGRPFAFFGHSLGALVAFETARELRRRGLAGPRKLVVSGRIAPQVPDPDKPIHTLPQAEFIQELMRLDGTPADVLAAPELMQFLVPIIRADFAMAETYAYRPEAPLECPISVYGGLADEHTSRDNLESWRAQTRAGFELRLFAGGHFFVQAAFAEVMQALDQDLSALAR